MSSTLQDEWVEKVLGLPASRTAPVSEKGKGKGKDKGFFASLKAKIFKPKPPPKPSEPGTVQKERAEKLLKQMPKEDQEKVQKILDDASASEKGYLLKAIASKHTAAEIEEFKTEIAGKDDEWLATQLHVVGRSSGKGIKQQWSDSCGPTTVQAMKAELDPIYALKLRKDNPDFMKVDKKDGLKLNKQMAEEQKRILEQGKGKAVSRSGDGGVGMMLATALSDQRSVTGLKFDYAKVDDNDIGASLTKVENALATGVPVPIGVGDEDKNGGHWVLLTGVQVKGKEKVYSIHDPWDGKIVKVTETQFKKKSFNIIGWNRFDDFYLPSPE